MPGCNSTFEMSFASMWLVLMKGLFKAPPDDVRKRARSELESAISSLHFSEDELRADIRAIAGEVRRAQQAHGKTNLVSLLNSSKSKRARLATVLKQRISLQNQYDALNSVELNQKVMSSVKQTSTALKALGLDTQLNEIDETMLDLKEIHDDVSNITEALQHNFSGVSMDESDLEKELAMLLQEGDPASVSMEETNEKPIASKPPAVQNSIQSAEPTAMESNAEDRTELVAQQAAVA